MSLPLKFPRSLCVMRQGKENFTNSASARAEVWWGSLCHGVTTWGCACADVWCAWAAVGAWWLVWSLLQTQQKCFLCLVFWGCLEKVMKSPDRFVGLCLTHCLMKAETDWSPQGFILQHLKARPPLGRAGVQGIGNSCFTTLLLTWTAISCSIWFAIAGIMLE